MSYLVKEIFYTLQGEGRHAGRPAVFCRFTACNLWSGREADRHKAICRFCDTDFVGGTRFATAEELAATAKAAWLGTWPSHRPMVVCTGGEPLLQLDAELTDALNDAGFYIAIETNGTIVLPPRHGIGWVCVSPKAGAALKLVTGDELKLVYPQPGADPTVFEGLDFTWHSLQPMDGPDVEANTAAALEYCLAHPDWQLSLQTHKHLGIR